jgi:hypothetical protein
MFFFDNEEEVKYERYRHKQMGALERENDLLRAQLRIATLSYEEFLAYNEWEKEYLRTADLGKFSNLEKLFSLYEEKICHTVPYIFDLYRECLDITGTKPIATEHKFEDGTFKWFVMDKGRQMELPFYVCFSLDCAQSNDFQQDENLNADYKECVRLMSVVFENSENLKYNLHSRAELIIKHVCTSFRNVKNHDYRPRLYKGDGQKFADAVKKHFGPFTPDKNYAARISHHYYMSTTHEMLLGRVLANCMALNYASKFYLNNFFVNFRRSLLKIEEVITEPTIVQIDDFRPTADIPIISDLTTPAGHPEIPFNPSEKQMSRMRDIFPGLSVETFKRMYYNIYSSKSKNIVDASTNTVEIDSHLEKSLTEKEIRKMREREEEERQKKIAELTYAQKQFTHAKDYLEYVKKSPMPNIKDPSCNAMLKIVLGTTDVLTYAALSDKLAEKDRALIEQQHLIKALEKKVLILEDEAAKERGSASLAVTILNKLNSILMVEFDSKIDLWSMPSDEFLNRIFEDKVREEVFKYEFQVKDLKETITSLNKQLFDKEEEIKKACLNAAMMKRPLEGIYSEFQTKMADTLFKFNAKLDESKHKVDSLVGNLPDYINHRVGIEVNKSIPKIVPVATEKGKEDIGVTEQRVFFKKNAQTVEQSSKFIEKQPQQQNLEQQQTKQNASNQDWEDSLSDSYYSRFLNDFKKKSYLHPKQFMPFRNEMSKDEWDWQLSVNAKVRGNKCKWVEMFTNIF